MAFIPLLLCRPPHSQVRTIFGRPNALPRTLFITEPTRYFCARPRHTASAPHRVVTVAHALVRGLDSLTVVRLRAGRRQQEVEESLSPRGQQVHVGQLAVGSERLWSGGSGGRAGGRTRRMGRARSVAWERGPPGRGGDAEEGGGGPRARSPIEY
jgi:hypothetical protein